MLGVGFIVIICLFAQSCVKDDSYNVGGGGQQQDLAARYLGTWTVDDQPARINYIVIIERHALYDDKIKLQNFANIGGTTVGLIVGNSVIIEKQPIGNGYESEGTGAYIKSNRLQFEFFLDDGIDNIHRKATFTK